MNLESKRPSGPLFPVGRDRDAWAIPDWAYAKAELAGIALTPERMYC